MPTTATPEPSRTTPGRPRDAEADQRILAAAQELYRVEGYHAVTVAAVARQAGLPRSTVYRRYRSVVALRYAAILVPPQPEPLPETGDLRADMRHHIDRNSQAFRSEGAVEFLRAMTADSLGDPAARTVVNEKFIAPRLVEVEGLLARAMERGELPPNARPAVLAEAITGTLIYHSLVLGRPVDDDFVSSLLDILFPAPQT